MLDERIEITLKKVGQQIENANELSIDLIDSLANEVEEYKDYKHEIDDTEIMYCEDVRDEIMGNEGIRITLKDNSTWNIVTTWSTDQKCIKHKLFSKGVEDEIHIFESIDNDNLFLCDDCKTFGKKHPEILNKYRSCSRYSDEWIFPIEWTAEGVNAWCKKREDKQIEYEIKKIEMEMEMEEEYHSLHCGNCSNCCHMKNYSCEYGNDIDYDNECEDWDER